MPDEKSPDEKTETAPEDAKPTAAAPANAAQAEPKAEAKKAEAAAADDEDDGDAEPASGGGDAFRPEEIAKRIEKIGAEDDIERLAREEEKKLAERRKAQKKGKGGLQQSASKRLAKIGDKPVKRAASAVAASDAGDPLLERAGKLNSWIRQNQKMVAGVVALVVVGVGGVMGFEYMQKKKETDASVVLAEAVTAERGVIGDPDKAKSDDGRPKDPRPVFKTVDDRRNAALAKYKDVESKYPGTGAAMLARLGEASILLDKHDADGAIAAYNDVKASPLAQADIEVRGRAFEGLGFAYELKATLKPEEKDKNLDEAMKAFKDLENLDARGFKELGMYHEARIFEAKGDKPKAIEVLGALRGKLQEKPPAERSQFPYLDTVVDDRLATLDPAAVPRKPHSMGGMGGGMGGLEQLLGGGNIDMNDPRIQDLIKNLGGGGGMPGPGGGAPPMPPPGAPKK